MLYFLGPNPYFPEATLVDLEEQAVLLIPDRGDSLPFTVDRSDAIRCPTFAENVPPAQCPVVVTSFAISEKGEDIACVPIEESIHFKLIVIPHRVESVLVNNRVWSIEADSFFPSNDPSDTEFRLHISHLPPGFYEATITFYSGLSGRITFIKFFPPRFSEGYPATQTERPETVSHHAFAAANDAELNNKALELSSEWGEHFCKPIHDRIRMFYSHLTNEEIDQLASLAREAESYIYTLGERELAGEIAERDIPKLAVERYPWLNRNNVQRLTGIAMFYARK